jgi:hypothetical protein
MVFNIFEKEYIGWDNQYKFVIDNLKNNTPFAYVRFNDGEMMGIDKIGSIVARGDQYIDETLHDKLKESISYKADNYFIGIPCSKCYPYYHNLAKNIIGDYDNIVSAVALTNRNWLKFIQESVGILSNRDVHYISGDDQTIDILINMFKFNIVNHIKVNNKNSWTDYDELKKHIVNINDGDVVLISLGPTARILCYDFFKQNNKATFIDIGSIFDPFTRNVNHNCHKGWENGFNITKKCEICN